MTDTWIRTARRTEGRPTMTKGKTARRILGIIRLVNGAAALLAPNRLVKMFGLDPDTNGAAVYALRLFGIRTVILGIQLLKSEGEALDEAVRYALPIHASDAASAALAGFRGELPHRAAITGTIVSSINTALAALARREQGSHAEALG